MQGDLISRQAVLDALYKLCNTNETLIENPWRDNPHIDALIDAIEELPSVNPQEPKWIPVSERLPNIHNRSENYLVTLKRGGVHIALFTECDGKHWWTYDDVIAWMPLPEPYKAEREKAINEWLDIHCRKCVYNDDRGTDFLNCQAECEVQKDVGIACIHYEEYVAESEVSNAGSN